jgi:glyoxylase-like metal-dependent hydrolase (beta-lactamase superfamily II)
MYNSIHSKLATLPDAVKVFPGHDYHDQFSSSTIGKEKQSNFAFFAPSLQHFQQRLGKL